MRWEGSFWGMGPESGKNLEEARCQNDVRTTLPSRYWATPRNSLGEASEPCWGLPSSRSAETWKGGLRTETMNEQGSEAAEN